MFSNSLRVPNHRVDVALSSLFKVLSQCTAPHLAPPYLKHSLSSVQPQPGGLPETFSNKLHVCALSRKMCPEKIACTAYLALNESYQIAHRSHNSFLPFSWVHLFMFSPLCISSSSALTFYPTAYNSRTEPTCSPIKVGTTVCTWQPTTYNKTKA